MKDLLYKEMKLSIHPFFLWMLPLTLSLLLLIPKWIFTLVFMYFFWISVPQIYSGYNAQLDQAFLSTLPISKKSIVHSKAVSLIVMELIHLAFGVIVAVIHVALYGSENFTMDVNPAFFGAVLVIYGCFNLTFLPGYFKTAYRFGIPLIIGVIVTLFVGTFFELGTVLIPFMGSLMKSTGIFAQSGLLVAGVALFAGMNFLAARLSYRNYIRIN